MNFYLLFGAITSILLVVFSLISRTLRAKKQTKLIQKMYKELSTYFQVDSAYDDQIINKINSFINNQSFVGHETSITLNDKVLFSTSLLLMLKHTNVEIEGYIKTVYITDKPRTKDHTSIYRSSSVVKDGNKFTIYINRQDLEFGFKNLSDNKNLLIHQFAHIIDGLDGKIDGFPALIIPQRHLDTWNTLSRKYMNSSPLEDTLFNRQLLGKRSGFFASMSEHYFENPNDLKLAYPEIYDFMKSIYSTKLDKED